MAATAVENMAVKAIPNGILRSIVGEQLSSVEFVQDYVQLHFDGRTLTAYTRPTVATGEDHSAWGQPGFRDALCERIARTVCSVAVSTGQEIRIAFDDGSSVAISLRPEDYSGPEAAMFQNPLDGTWDVW